MEKNIIEAYKPLEKKRRQIRTLLVFRILMYIAPAPVFIVNLVLFIVRLAAKGNFNVYNLAFFTLAILIPFGIIMMLSAIASKMRKKWYIKYKEILIHDRFALLFSDSHFVHDKGIPKNVICSSGLVKEGDKYLSEDYLAGTYNTVKFERCDVVIKQTQPTRRVNFSGQWMIFDFNKPIDAYVRIVERYSYKNNKKFLMVMPHVMLIDRMHDKLKNGGPNTARNKDVKEIEFEDIEFNKKFVVTTTNSHTAFYLITPHFMESVKFLEKSLPGLVMLAFVNNQLHVGLHTRKNFFEPRLNKKIDERLINSIDKDAKTICEFIDILQLDDNYFKPIGKNK